MKRVRSIVLAALATITLVPQSHAVLYWGRAYDSNLQRWIERDPIGERGGINLYQFVLNNPINVVDPDGLDPAFSPGIGMFTSLTAAQQVEASRIGAPAAVGIATAMLTGDAAAPLIARLFGPGSFGTYITVGALSGLGGDAAYQGSRIGFGDQHGFDWTEFGINGGIGAGFGAAARGLDAIFPSKCVPNVRIAPGAGYPSQTLGGTTYTGGYDPNANVIFLGDAGHPQGVFAAGGNPSAPGLAGITVVDNGQSLLWNNASPSLNAILTADQRAAVQAALQSAFPGRTIQYAPGLR